MAAAAAPLGGVQTHSVDPRLEDCPRETVSRATVVEMWDESSTVKGLKLRIHNQQFTFKAGQWVDFYAPGIAEMTGFSFCSNPEQLESEGVIELAVKDIVDNPAHWVHTQCKVGVEVTVRVGGNFYFDPRPSDPPVNLLLVAGGVGINPLRSILMHCVHLMRQRVLTQAGCQLGKIHLIFTARTISELIFKDWLLSLVQEFPGKMSLRFHITRCKSPVTKDLKPYTTVGRITGQDLLQASQGSPHCFVCGPSSMYDFVTDALGGAGIPKDNVFYEKWQ
ncbi:oxidoreductase NAD-binding domain-containing protein 1 isoform X2 [Lethenteron reissneri]|nr:oxidoreductase NAD-binding domain-containing protein 1 isoform X2 [Lethenteron reissneri]XP_061411683.1 oxidoreductase NAD-binding domain-containing protein 1 isoform X2 [Lethenteron reissneri]XP_061411684.1 oxidoreductase NAD-binding domain-containing protein 1 isoform X2 [Lethenteron reissneri]XP_061411685.1 oxidoreductase NAD-binding domain-containing protein 1 isoform X2 [Lethenteron reissneri]